MTQLNSLSRNETTFPSIETNLRIDQDQNI